MRVLLCGCKNLEKIIIQANLKFHKKPFKKMFKMDLPNLKFLKIDYYDKRNINIDPKFVVKCLSSLKSMKILNLNNEIYYRQEDECLNSFKQYDYNECYKHFPAAVTDANKAFHTQEEKFIFKKFYMF